MLPKEGREGAASRKPEVAIRVASAIVLAALALGAAVLSPWTFLVLVMVGGGLIAWEWGRLTRGNGFDGTALISAVSVAAIAVFVSLGRPDFALFILAAAAVTIGFTAFPSVGAGWSLAGLAYAALPAAALVWLRGASGGGARMASRRPGSWRGRRGLSFCRCLDHGYGLLCGRTPYWRAEARAAHLAAEDLERVYRRRRDARSCWLCVRARP